MLMQESAKLPDKYVPGFLKKTRKLTKQNQMTILLFQTDTVRNLCRETGMKGGELKGSKLELVLQLKKRAMSRSKFSKLFTKFWRASGKVYRFTIYFSIEICLV